MLIIDGLEEYIKGCTGPQSNGSLSIVDIDASKWFVDLWDPLRFLQFSM